MGFQEAHLQKLKRDAVIIYGQSSSDVVSLEAISRGLGDEAEGLIVT